MIDTKKFISQFENYGDSYEVLGAKKWEDRNNNQVSLSIKKEDFVKIKNHFESQASWNFTTCVRGGNRKDRMDATISDIFLKKFFYNMDYHKKSSAVGPSKILKFLGEDLEHHFIRGWFDGDGSFYNHRKRVCDNRAAITSDKNENWDALTEIYDKLKIKYTISRTDHSSHVNVSKEDGFNKLFKYMYADDEGAFLPRKKDRFLAYFKRMTDKRIGQSSQYRGVTKSNGKWLMQFRSRFAPKKITQHFENELDAAREYDRLSLKYIGEKAHLNFNNYD